MTDVKLGREPPDSHRLCLEVSPPDDEPVFIENGPRREMRADLGCAMQLSKERDREGEACRRPGKRCRPSNGNEGVDIAPLARAERCAPSRIGGGKECRIQRRRFGPA
jgi:hypothetical protein